MTNELGLLEVYFETLNLEEMIEQPAYDTWQFISDLGGSVGLWVGASMMTVFEFGEFFLDALILCCAKSGRSGSGKSHAQQRRRQQQQQQHMPKPNQRHQKHINHRHQEKTNNYRQEIRAQQDNNYRQEIRAQQDNNYRQEIRAQQDDSYPGRDIRQSANQWGFGDTLNDSLNNSDQMDWPWKGRHHFTRDNFHEQFSQNSLDYKLNRNQDRL